MISKVIGLKLKKIREDKKYSLEKVSELTGVSKPSINNIERGLTSPTIDILWKIATGLSVPISYFFSEPKTNYTLTNVNELTKVPDTNESVNIYTIFDWFPTDNFECFYIELVQNSKRVSQPHARESKEIIVVLEGCLTMLLGQEKIICEKDSFFKFDSDVPHTYVNEGPSITKAMIIMI